MSDSRKKIAYITKRLLIRKSTKAIQDASEKAMDSVGYIIVARDGWVIKEYRDGTIERLEKLEVSCKDQELILD